MHRRPSLRRKLPLLISALLGLVVIAVSWSAYREIENVLLSASEVRLASATIQLAQILEASARQLRGDVRRLAADPALARFLAHPTAASRAAAVQLLERQRARATQPATYALWTPDQRRLLEAGPAPSALDAAALPLALEESGRAVTGNVWVGPLVVADSGVAYAVVAPVIAAGKDTLGFVVSHRRMRSDGAARIAGLIGSSATLLVRNAAGGPWSDLTRQVAGPPGRITPGAPTAFTSADGKAALGVAARIDATPWMIWIQVPRAVILASARHRTSVLAGIALVFVALGTLGAWILSHRVTAPLVEMTRAAEAVARGDYTRRVSTRRRDELGSLALSFNSMAAQVDAATQALQARAGELEAANAGLRASEERYRQLVEAAHEGICTVDATGIVTFATARLGEMLGYESGELPGRAIFDLMDADVAFHARTQFARWQRGIAETGEIPLRRKDGGTVWVNQSVSSLFDASGSFTGALFMLGDVTERHAAQEQLARSERQFRALIENAQDMIRVLDADGRQRYASPAHERYLGYTPAELEGRIAFDFIHPDDLSRIRATYAQLIARPGGTASVRFRYRHENGTWRELASMLTNLLDDPAVGGVVVNSRDVTEQRALEAQLLQAQKMEAVGQLAGGVAHDFNNVLTVVTSYTGILLAELPPADPMYADLQEIRRAADRAAGLTRQLLAFSRRQVLQPRVLDLNAVVHDIEKMLGRVLREDVRLTTRLAPTLGRVYADPSQLEQVIVNLVVNARDAMPDGGTLTIETADVVLDDAYGHLHVDVTPGPYVMLAVSDTGIGMDATTRERIFEPFFTTKAVGKGTGLGLSTVYGIVKQSGGHIGVYSEPGIGTTLKIYLPRASAPGDARTRAGGDASVHPGSGTVLLVEDDAPVRMAAQRILTRAGYAVLAAADGAEALRLCAQHEGAIDVLLTDLVMPDMSGRELADRFRALHPTTGMAFMSGYTEDAVLRQGGFEPGTVFIPKPFTPQTLTLKLRELLDGGRRGHAA